MLSYLVTIYKVTRVFYFGEIYKCSDPIWKLYDVWNLLIGPTLHHIIHITHTLCLDFSLIKLSVSHSFSWIHDWSSLKLHLIFITFSAAHVLVVDVFDIIKVSCKGTNMLTFDVDLVDDVDDVDLLLGYWYLQEWNISWQWIVFKLSCWQGRIQNIF